MTAVGQIHAADLAGWQRRVPTQFADDMDGVVVVDHLAVARNQHTDIVQMGQGPGRAEDTSPKPRS